MHTVKINSVRDAIQSEFWHSTGKDLLEYLLSRGLRIMVFAGGVRDVVLSQECGGLDVKLETGISGMWYLPR
jgi:hypothetical protein